MVNYIKARLHTKTIAWLLGVKKKTERGDSLRKFALEA